MLRIRVKIINDRLLPLMKKIDPDLNLYKNPYVKLHEKRKTNN